MSLEPGQHLAQYRIDRKLGEGGMGEVWAASDTRLQRPAAIKALPASVASDPERLARFHREAQVLASLNHPNIAGIYGLEEIDGTPYLAMELVEGDDLSTRIDDHALPLDEALEIATQIARALEAAHDKGIVHRDLKPANVKVTRDGAVKVLDFGLAKAMDQDEAPADASQALTMTSPAATQAGMILGTAAYMAPEQARGKTVDRRADIWAFGVVLFEMLSGTRAFGDEDVSMTLSRILQRDPDFGALPASLPARVTQVLRLCLRKDPKQRVGDIRDVRLVLEGAFDTPAAPEAANPLPAAGRTRERAAWAVAAVASLAALWLAFGALNGRPAADPPQLMRVQVMAPEGYVISGTVSSSMLMTGVRAGWAQIAPDGRTLLMSGTAGLWLRSMASGAMTLMPDTEGATYPFWSPDSQHVAFFRQGKLKRVAAAGGPIIDICDAADARGGTWSRDDTILFAPALSTGLYRVPANGGTPEIVLTPTPGVTGEYIRYPSFLPDGQHFLFQRTTPDEAGFYIGSLDGVPPRLLRPEASSAVYAPPPAGDRIGRLLFLVNADMLVSQPFDLEALQLVGEMSPIEEAVATSGQNANGTFSVSNGGVLVFANRPVTSVQLTLFSRQGSQIAPVSPPASGLLAALSRDGRQVALTYGPADWALYLQQVGGGPATRIAEPTVIGPRWSPDGRRILLARPGLEYELFVKDLAGDAREESLGVRAPNALASDWSLDGRWIAYGATSNQSGGDLWLLPLFGDRKPVSFLSTPARETDGRFSPDAKWLAFLQSESGGPELYVQAISPEGHATGIKYRISAAGGLSAFWRGDGSEIVYQSTDREVITVPVTLGATVKQGTPQTLFELPNGAELLGMTDDAQRFLASVPAGGATQLTGVTVVVNWQAGLPK